MSMSDKRVEPLSGEQFDQLATALLAAYPKEAALNSMVRRTFGKGLRTFVGGDNQAELIDDLIEQSFPNNEIVALLRGAHRRNSANKELRTFLDKYFADILKRNIGCIENNTQFQQNTTIIRDFLEIPILDVRIEDLVEAARSSFRPGVLAIADDPKCKDFNDPSLVSGARFCGFLELALTHHPGAPNQPTLVLFADELLRIVQDLPLQSALSAWTDRAKAECGYIAPGSASGKAIAPHGDLQVSLMITVGHSTKYIEEKPAYEVRGALFYDQITGIDEQSLPLPFPDELFIADGTESAGGFCLWRDIEDYINRFVRAAIQKLRDLKGPQGLNYETYQLSLEVFLPLAHLGKGIDQFKREMPPSRRNRSQPLPLGNNFGVIVRSYDRFDLLGEYDKFEGPNETLRAWRDLQTCLEEQLKIIEQFEPLETITPECYQQLEARLKQKLGLKICCGLPSSEREQQQLFEAMLYGAVPVAVWTRSSDIVETKDGQVVPLEISSALDELLSEAHLRSPAALSQSLMRLRQAAYGDPLPEKKDRCLGHHVAFLLDNPNRLPPAFVP